MRTYFAYVDIIRKYRFFYKTSKKFFDTWFRGFNNRRHRLALPIHDCRGGVRDNDHGDEISLSHQAVAGTYLSR